MFNKYRAMIHQLYVMLYYAKRAKDDDNLNSYVEYLVAIEEIQQEIDDYPWRWQEEQLLSYNILSNRLN